MSWRDIVKNDKLLENNIMAIKLILLKYKESEAKRETGGWLLRYSSRLRELLSPFNNPPDLNMKSAPEMVSLVKDVLRDYDKTKK